MAEAIIPIGRPIANARIYILDPHGEPVPVGVAGEMYIGGTGVARGYLNRPELTAERFLQDWFVEEFGARMYRTGDLGRWLPDGTIEFLSRNDDQVKIRGFRIELGEIEATLASHAGIREAVVIAREDEPGEKRLVVYYTPAKTERVLKGESSKPEGVVVGAEQLRAHLAAKLPEYMVPAAYVRLERLPLTPNGKLDRKALPAPEANAYCRRGYEEPQGEIETILAAGWADLLTVERVGRQDNFFELGGHSLLAVTMIERMRRSGLQVDVRALFATPTLADLAASVKVQASAVEIPVNRIPVGCDTITVEMLSLVELSQQEIDCIVNNVPGGAGNVQDIYPLAPLQEGILFHHLMGGDGDPYLLVNLMSFEARPLLERYVEAMQGVMDRHDILRTAVVWEGLREPVQVVWRKAPLVVEEVTLDASAGDVAEQLYERFNPRRYRIDVRQAPLLRVYIAHDEPNERWLMVQLLHHLVDDNTSLKRMRAEIGAHLLDRVDQLPEPQPFRNLVAQARLGVSQEEHEAFFRKVLGDVEEPTAPFGLLDVQGDGTGIEEARIMLDSALAQGIRERARRLGVSAASVCHVAWAQVLARVSGRKDVVFGTVLFGRMQGGAGADLVMGLFINTLPVRIQIGEEGAEASVRRTHNLLAELLRHEHASLALAQRCSRVPAPSPLFSALLNYRHIGVATQAPSAEAPQALEGMRWVRSEERTNYPFMLSVEDLGERFGLTAQTLVSIDPKRVCEFMRTALESLVEALETTPGRAVRTLEVLPEAERHQLLCEWNETTTEYPREKSFIELFEEQVERRGSAIAVVDGGEELSYEELNRRGNRVGHQLREVGVGPGKVVGLLGRRSASFLVGLMGILKAGGAYLPLDAKAPVKRQREMVEESQMSALLVSREYAKVLREEGEGELHGRGVEIRILEDIVGGGAEGDGWSENLRVRIWGRELAYVIYTSGSTGKPKGVMVEQGGMMNHLYAKVVDLELGEADVVAQTASQSFDISVWQFLASLLVGGQVVVVGEKEAQDAEELEKVLVGKRVTIFETVPSMLQAMVGEAEGKESGEWGKLRWVLVTGEACPVELWRKWRRSGGGIGLLNAYGPTECSDDVTHYIASGRPEKGISSVPIGRPVANTRAYVLDEEMEVVPVGVAGELYIGGEGVGRGYIRHGELTAERFVPDPFAKGGRGGRLYRTGDRVRYRRDGNLEFLGRLDQQVKVRGYRIELGEIEATLASHAGIRAGVVIAREDTPGEKRLVAYYTSAKTEMLLEGESSEPKGVVVGAEQLRAHLAAQLPEYMVPAAYVRLERLPLTPNGKLDRKALPAPEADAYSICGYEAPQGEMETILAAVWAEVLKVERVGRQDNFFELGGHSLLAVRVISRVRQALEVKVLLGDLFAQPVLSDFARNLEEAVQAKLPPITVAERGERLPLSFAQQRLWFLAQIEGVSEAYHIPFGVRLKGRLDQSVLRQALNRIVARHEALRTTFVALEGQPVQRIASVEDSGFHLVEHDLRNESDMQGDLDQLTVGEARASFDLERGPLIRGRLIRLGEDEHALLITMHHIVSDGWSMGVMFNELSMLYGAFVRGEGDSLEELRVQYADYAVWQRKWMEGEILQEQAEYWKRTLAGAPGLLDIPTDYVRPAEKDYAGASIGLELDAKLTAGLRELSRRYGTTMYMTLLAGWVALLGRLSGQQDVVVGTPVANRGRSEIEGLIGFFVNTLVLRLDVSGAPTVGELLKQAKAQAIAAQQHQDIPFEQVVEIVRPVRSLGHSPVFQVMFAWANMPAGRLEFHRLEIKPLASAPHGVAKFDLTLALQEAGERIVGAVEYATSLYEQSTVGRYLGYFRKFLEGMVADDTQAVDRVPLLTAPERHRLLYEWNEAGAEYPRERCIHELFEEQVKRSPEATAVVFEEASLSYGELNGRANRLGHYLRELGVKPDTRVGICAERGLEMVVGLLAILKAGGAYVPLDPGYPVERLRYMLEDSAPAVLLTQGHLKELFSGISKSLLVLDLAAGSSCWENQPEENPERASMGLMPDHLAYMIYTSGSTGMPKGVMVSHHNLVSSTSARKLAYGGFGRFLLLSPISFDSSIAGVFGTLINAGTLFIAGHDILRDPARLNDYIQRSRVESLLCVPSLYQQILEDSVASEHEKQLSCVIVAGEVCPPNLVTKSLQDIPEAALFNEYGPTEGTVWASMHRCVDQSAQRSVPIGRPIANARIYIVDGQGEPVPVGVRGELYIGGAGVARGYLNRAELTAERFVGDPFSAEPGARMYKTGDLGRWLPDGTIEFLGRNDDQVKIRGFRIELGEIEAKLASHAGVREAVVIAREDTPGEKRLVAYYSAATTERVLEGESGEPVGVVVGAEQLRAYLAAKLPEYMVPAAYVKLERMPLTPNGKLDRKALPLPEFLARRNHSIRTLEEEMLRSLFAEVLGVAQVELDDNFFELGGHSLLVAQLGRRIRAVLGVETSIRTFLEAPTVASLATRLHIKPSASSFEVILPIRSGGTLPPLFLVHPAYGLSWCYVGFLKYVEPERPIYGLQARSFTASRNPEQTAEEMAVDYVDEIRKIQPAGPYYLIGWSIGGLLAFAMANLLQSQGEQIALLSLLDTVPFNPHEAENLIRNEPPSMLSVAAANFGDDLKNETPSLSALYIRLLSSGRLPPSFSEQHFSALLGNWMASYGLQRRFVPKVYNGDLLLFVTTVETSDHATVAPGYHEKRASEAWRPYINGDIRIFSVACGHEEMVNPRPLAEIGTLLAIELRKRENISVHPDLDSR